MSYRRLAASVFATTALAVTGCGNGSSSGSLTRAELIAKADVICGRINNEISTLTYKTPQDIALLAPKLASYEEASLVELRKLKAPTALAADWARILADTSLLARDTARLGAYAQQRNFSAGFALIAKDQPTHVQALAIAKRDGFGQCSRPG